MPGLRHGVNLNLAAVLRVADQHPVAVMSHIKPALYRVEPKLFEAMLEEMGPTCSPTMCMTRSAMAWWPMISSVPSAMASICSISSNKPDWPYALYRYPMMSRLFDLLLAERVDF